MLGIVSFNRSSNKIIYISLMSVSSNQIVLQHQQGEDTVQETEGICKTEFVIYSVYLSCSNTN